MCYQQLFTLGPKMSPKIELLTTTTAVSGGCLVGVLRMSGGFLDGVWRVSMGYPNGVWGVSIYLTGQVRTG